MFAKKKLSKKLYIFEKPLTMPFQICKNICKISKFDKWKWVKTKI